MPSDPQAPDVEMAESVDSLLRILNIFSDSAPNEEPAVEDPEKTLGAVFAANEAADPGAVEQVIAAKNIILEGIGQTAARIADTEGGRASNDGSMAQTEKLIADDDVLSTSRGGLEDLSNEECDVIVVEEGLQASTVSANRPALPVQSFQDR